MQMFIQCPSGLFVGLHRLVKGFMMELDKTLFFRSTCDLFMTPILLKLAVDEQFYFIRELDGLGLAFMTFFSQPIVLCPAVGGDISAVRYCGLSPVRGCFRNATAPLQFNSSMCQLCAQSRYSIFRRDLGVHSSLLASVNNWVSVYFTWRLGLVL